MKTFKTVIIYKADKPQRTVNTGLTKAQAQKEVQRDIDVNPNCESYMLVYSKEC